MGTTPSPSKAGSQTPTGREDGMVAISYILAGLLFYGGLGVLGDHYFGTAWLSPVGLIVGLVASIYLVYKRYGSVK
ncbi:hypothetical protein [uncultured Tessaracoccus sp.]|uniref:hypothetical protein n=1 Tax=uncultured Tessaracoccus sp. TaxID=905023 RepID=UPI0025F5E469|nr:hypothetical protein [uncultured Tessaracoccus sp.]